jgi:hypothetical protein
VRPRSFAIPVAVAALGCDPPSAIGRVPSPAVADAEPETPRASLRCGTLSRADDTVRVDLVGGRDFALRGERTVARGGPWLRGSTNRTGALVVPDAECGVRVFEREEDSGAVAIHARGCVPGLRGTRSVQLFFNQNVSGLCALRDDGALLVGEFDVARAVVASRPTVRGASALCGRADWWGAAIAGGDEGRQLQFLADVFQPSAPPFDLPDEVGVGSPAAVVNNQSHWDALWYVEGDVGLLHERYRPVGDFAPGSPYPRRLEGVSQESSQRWNASEIGARRVRVLDAFDTGGGLLALARLDGPERAWIDGLFFCAGAGVRARRLYDREASDAMLVGLGDAHALVTLRQEGTDGVLEATWLASDFRTRGPARELFRAPSLVLHGVDVAPGVGTFLVWHSRATADRHELRVSAFELTR